MADTESQSIYRNLAYYSECFSDLNVSSSRKKGNAHYKPILLLSVIDLIAQGIVTENQILVSDELIDTFNKYWNTLASESSYKGGLHYPFFHLQSEGFWHLTFKPDFNGLQPKTVNKLKQAVEYASLDSELFDLLQDPTSCQELIDTIVAVWFSANQKELNDLLPINQSFQESTQEEIQEDGDLSQTNKAPKFVLRKSVVRNAFFRKSIVHVYDYRCAICRLKVMRSLTQTIVDGAHIKPFAQFYDNQIGNGLSLCKNHHWGFDKGWFGIDQNYKIIVAEDLEEDSPHAKPLKDFHSESILLPEIERYFPSLESLAWHRTHILKL
jgi:putative restriction endonuclease